VAGSCEQSNELSFSIKDRNVLTGQTINCFSASGSMHGLSWQTGLEPDFPAAFFTSRMVWRQDCRLAFTRPPVRILLGTPGCPWFTHSLQSQVKIVPSKCTTTAFIEILTHSPFTIILMSYSGQHNFFT
jgi:hypothetical protein